MTSETAGRKPRAKATAKPQGEARTRRRSAASSPEAKAEKARLAAEKKESAKAEKARVQVAKAEAAREAAAALRQRIMGRLAAAKANTSKYPLTVAELQSQAELTSAETSALLKSPKDFQVVTLASTKSKGKFSKPTAAQVGVTFVVPEPDTEALVHSDRLLVATLGTLRSPATQALDLPALAKNLPTAFQASFRAFWTAAVSESRLPEGVGAVHIKSKPQLFLLTDLVVAARTESKSVTITEPLEQRLLAAFESLRDLGGKDFYVSLYDLRGALRDVSRQDFDAALNQLRRDWVLTLNPAEGRHETVPQEILDAGIMEQSRLLVYAARRET